MIPACLCFVKQQALHSWSYIMFVVQAGGQEDPGEPSQEAGDGGAAGEQTEGRHSDQVSADPADGWEDPGETAYWYSDPPSFLMLPPGAHPTDHFHSSSTVLLGSVWAQCTLCCLGKLRWSRMVWLERRCWRWTGSAIAVLWIFRFFVQVPLFFSPSWFAMH